MKVMIVDDEYLIREGLRKSVPWEKYGMEVVATAENGEEGIFMAQEYQPDLIVTDICMPFVDGLEMAEHLLKNRPDTIIIILTCYDEFEYARKALKLGAFDYVLKPVDMVVFENLLVEVQKKYELRNHQHNGIESALSNVVHRRENASFLQDCLKKSGQEDGLAYCCMIFQLLGFGYAQNVLAPEDLHEYLTQLSNLLKVCSGEKEMLLEGQEDDGRYLVIIGNQDRGMIQQTVNQICRNVRKEDRIRDDYPLLCAISDCVQGEEALVKAYQQCKEIVRTSYLYDDTQFIQYHDLNHQKEETKDITSLIDAFCDTLRTFDNQTIQAKLKEISENIRCSGRDSLLYGHVFVATVFTNTLKIAQESGVEMSDFGEDFTNEFQRIIRMDSLSSQLQKIGELTERLCDIIMSNKISPHTSIIQRAKTYVNSNYTDNTLSLQRVSSEAHMSPSYFSILFKQTVGKSFITYLTDLRMERAKYLLCNTSQKAYEISYAVGYDNPTYFSTLFKKCFGMGPIEYRQQFLEALPEKSEFKKI